METKKHFREQVFRLREQMEEEQLHKYSEMIKENIFSMRVYQERRPLFIYVDFNREVATHSLIESALSQGREVAVPKIRNRSMVFIRIESLHQLGKGYFGIMEPRGGQEVEDEDALMIIPGVAFDRKLHRIGYGGGYYDRYLAAHPRIQKLALGFDFQVFPEIPSEETDICMDYLVTEKEILQR